MTVRELHRAVDGYAEAHGFNRGPDYDALLEWAENEPDTSSIVGAPGARDISEFQVTDGL